jgi:IS1 family transposase
MNNLSIEKRCKIIQLLVEGNSLRGISRITDVSINTVTKLLENVGRACLKFHSETVVQLRSSRVEVDEMHSFINTRDKNVKEEKFGMGSVWTWVGIDADTRLIISWFVGKRDQQSANFFMNDLWCRLRTRVQLTSDGYKGYQEAVAGTFGSKVDFAQLVKQYSNDSINKEGKKDKRMLYIGADRQVISGNPDKTKISTSYVERSNLTMRMSVRRLARKTNAFSKKYDNHCYAIALHFVYYNFVRIHKSLRVTPAMEAGLIKRFMTFEDIVNLVPLPPPRKLKKFY